MLDSLRKLGSSVFGKIMLGFLLVGLAGFGISGVLTTIGSNTIARVGDQEISIRDFQRAYNNQINAAAQQIGSLPTAEQALAMGIPGSVLNSLAGNAALDTLGGRMGLGASDTRLGRILREDPNFAGTLGQFDRATFQRALQSAGFTEAEYLNTLNKSASRQQIVTATLAEVDLPEAALDIVQRYSGDKRTVSYYVLRPENITPPAAPTEAEMAAYLDDNQQNYRTEPTRTANFMVLTLDSLAENVTVTEDQIAEEYERTKSSLTAPETRQIRQVVLNDDQKAAFETGHAEGKSFDELLAASGLLPTDLGTLTEANITDATLGETAFALDEGDFALIPGALGTRAVEVQKINAAGMKTLEEARADIEQSLRLRAARTEYADVLDGIEELRAALKPLDEIAARFNLDVSEVTLTSEGSELSSVSSIPAESDGRVANRVFETDLGALAPSVALGANINVWFDLQSIEEARDQTLDEVRDTVKQAMIDERADAALDAAAEADVAAVKGGLPLDLAASTRGTFAAPSESFSRSGIAESAIDSAVAGAAFSGPAGLVGSARNGSGNYVVFTVTNVTPPADPPADAVRDYVATGWRDTVYAALLTALRDDAGVSVSQKTLAQTIGLPAEN
jgi:peptidyl-prolyl cis-trans isomerase D